MSSSRCIGRGCTTARATWKAQRSFWCERIGTEVWGTSISTSTRNGCASKTCSIPIGRRVMIHILRASGLVAIVVAAGACASAVASGPEAIARLERQRASNPQSEPVLRSLGIAYYKSGNLKDGLTAEGQNDFGTARSAYSSYDEYGRTSRVRHVLEARLASLQRKELLETVRADVRNEEQLAQQTGAPNVVAVMPLT